MSKGQSINIDWTVAISLFIFTTISTVTIFVTSQTGFTDNSNLQGLGADLQSNLEDETSIRGGKSPVHVEGSTEIGSIPVDRTHHFPDSAETGSAAMSVPSEINESENRLVTVLDLKNTTYSIVYFEEAVEPRNYSDSVDLNIEEEFDSTEVETLGGDFSLTLEDEGLSDLSIDGFSILDDKADLNAENSGENVEKKELYVSALEEDLKIYNGSKEFIIEDVDEDVNFELIGFDSVYWYPEESDESLSEGDSFEEETPGFTLSDSDDGFGITFMGDLEVNLEKNNEERVLADIDTLNDGQVRVKLHREGYSYEKGRDRIKFFDKGRVTFGVWEEFSAAYDSRIQDLNSSEMSEEEFEDALNTENLGYNVSYGSAENISRGSSPPLDADVVVSNKRSLKINRTGGFSDIPNQVMLWR